MTKTYAFQIERNGRVLARGFTGTKLQAERRAKELAKQHDTCVGYIDETKLAGFTGHHSEMMPMSDEVFEPWDLDADDDDCDIRGSAGWHGE